MIPDEKEAGRLYKISQELEYDPFIKLLTPSFDLDKTLSLLKKNYFLAIASNRAKSLKKLVNEFKLYDHINFVMSSLDANPKPDPEMLFKCIDHFIIKKEEALFLGDAISDELAAKNAKIDFLWIGADKNPSISSVADLLDFF